MVGSYSSGVLGGLGFLVRFLVTNKIVKKTSR